MIRFFILLGAGFQFLAGSPVNPSDSDRIAGALFGSAIGDAFGFISSSCSSQKALTAAYGKSGLSSVSQFRYDDWFVDASETKRISYTRNTMISAVSCSLLCQMRTCSMNSDYYLKRFPLSYQAFYGEEDAPWSKQFLSWFTKHTGSLKHENEHPITQCYYWVSQGGDNRIHYSYHNAADERSLSRVWPIALVFADNQQQAMTYADCITLMTHCDPTARAASAAYVAGLASLVKGASLDESVALMIQEAEKFDLLELNTKTGAVKCSTGADVTTDMIAQGKVLTSDLIRYALWQAQQKKTITEIFGLNSKRKENNRSFRGCLLGYQADEVVAGAVFLAVKRPACFKKLLADATRICGNSALISSLAGALVGAQMGGAAIRKEGYSQVIDLLENSEKINQLPLHIEEAHTKQCVPLESPERVSAHDAAFYFKVTQHRVSRSLLLQPLLFFGGCILGAYLFMRNA